MKRKLGQSGVSLMEMTVVVSIVALLAVLAMPAVKALIGSFETAGSTRCMISAALSTARGIAAKEQHYAGVRFQKAYNPDDPNNPLNASQYMIFIVNDPKIGAYFFRAVDNLQPIKLPESIGVMDFTIVIGRKVQNPANPTQQIRLDDPLLGGNNRIDNELELADTTTFSIIFSPSGKVVIHGIRIRNRDGRTDDSSTDDVFNTVNNVVAGIGRFYQDDYFNPPPEGGLGPEPSRNSFIIYETEKFKQAYNMGRAWTDYLNRLAFEGMVCINPYTGTIIER